MEETVWAVLCEVWSASQAREVNDRKGLQGGAATGVAAAWQSFYEQRISGLEVKVRPCHVGSSEKTRKRTQRRRDAQNCGLDSIFIVGHCPRIFLSTKNMFRRLCREAVIFMLSGMVLLGVSGAIWSYGKEPNNLDWLLVGLWGAGIYWWTWRLAIL
jgi:hypothetical protein